MQSSFWLSLEFCQTKSMDKQGYQWVSPNRHLHYYFKVLYKYHFDNQVGTLLTLKLTPDQERGRTWLTQDQEIVKVWTCFYMQGCWNLPTSGGGQKEGILSKNLYFEGILVKF